MQNVCLTPYGVLRSSMVTPLVKGIQVLEQVQWRATKLVTGLKKKSSDDRLALPGSVR